MNTRAKTARNGAQRANPIVGHCPGNRRRRCRRSRHWGRSICTFLDTAKRVVRHASSVPQRSQLVACMWPPAPAGFRCMPASRLETVPAVAASSRSSPPSRFHRLLPRSFLTRRRPPRNTTRGSCRSVRVRRRRRSACFEFAGAGFGRPVLSRTERSREKPAGFSSREPRGCQA